MSHGIAAHVQILRNDVLLVENIEGTLVEVFVIRIIGTQAGTRTLHAFRPDILQHYRRASFINVICSGKESRIGESFNGCDLSVDVFRVGLLQNGIVVYTHLSPGSFLTSIVEEGIEGAGMIDQIEDRPFSRSILVRGNRSLSFRDVLTVAVYCWMGLRTTSRKRTSRTS